VTVKLSKCKDAYSRSAGLEEYIEGLSFLHYLEKGSLISLEEVQETLSDKETGDNVRPVTKARCTANHIASHCDTGGLRLGNVGSYWRADAICDKW
jgi:hypothetical protein